MKVSEEMKNELQDAAAGEELGAAEALSGVADAFEEAADEE
jgi:hypothetical protein